MEGEAMERRTDRRRKAERLERRTARCQLASLSACEELNSESLSLLLDFMLLLKHFKTSSFFFCSLPEKQESKTLRGQS